MTIVVCYKCNDKLMIFILEMINEKNIITASTIHEEPGFVIFNHRRRRRPPPYVQRYFVLFLSKWNVK